MINRDKKIIKSIQQGKNSKTLNQLYKTVFPQVEKYILNNSGSGDDAFDIFQDAVLVFFRYVKEDKFDQSMPIAAFIFSVSRNLWINKVKRESRLDALNDTHFNMHIEQDFSTAIISKEREQFIDSLLSRLGQRCKELLINTIYNKLSMKQVCQEMGFESENAAKTKHYKCKQRLIKIIEEKPEYYKEMLQ